MHSKSVLPTKIYWVHVYAGTIQLRERIMVVHRYDISEFNTYPHYIIERKNIAFTYMDALYSVRV